jgi:hypothetical protein
MSLDWYSFFACSSPFAPAFRPTKLHAWIRKAFNLNEAEEEGKSLKRKLYKDRTTVRKVNMSSTHTVTLQRSEPKVTSSPTTQTLQNNTSSNTRPQYGATIQSKAAEPLPRATTNNV